MKKEKSGFIQDVKIKTWTGRETIATCDDNLNAHVLFSSAPELLEALEHLVRILNDVDSGAEAVELALLNAKQVIKKTRG
jgi:hypothetical protein